MQARAHVMTSLLATGHTPPPRPSSTLSCFQQAHVLPLILKLAPGPWATFRKTAPVGSGGTRIVFACQQASAADPQVHRKGRLQGHQPGRAALMAHSVPAKGFAHVCRVCRYACAAQPNKLAGKLAKVPTAEACG